MLVSKEQVLDALAHSHDACAKNPDGCVHAAALKGSEQELNEHLIKCALLSVGSTNPALSMWFVGLHVGYRLHELETQSVPKGKEN
jgi:hypothetical protein